MKMFRELSEQEIIEYKAWARKNYVPFNPIKGIWHPVVQAECAKMNEEAEVTVSMFAGGVEKGLIEGNSNG